MAKASLDIGRFTSLTAQWSPSYSLTSLYLRISGGSDPRKSRCSASTFISPYDLTAPATKIVALVYYPTGLGGTDFNYL